MKGDIIKVNDLWIGIVKYDTAAFYFESKQDSLNNSWLHIFNSIVEYEVIGNVYENKELLDETNTKQRI